MNRRKPCPVGFYHFEDQVCELLFLIGLFYFEVHQVHRLSAHQIQIYCYQLGPSKETSEDRETKLVKKFVMGLQHLNLFVTSY